MRWQIAARKAALNIALHCTALYGARRDAAQSSCRRCSPARNRKPRNFHHVQLLPFSPSHWLAAPPHTVHCRQSVREECSGLVLTTVNPDHCVSG